MQKEGINCDSLTAKMFERRESVADRPSVQRNENEFPGTERSNSVDLNTTSNGIKVRYTNSFRSLLSLKQVCCSYFERTCKPMLDPMNLPDKTFAERSVLVLFKL